MTLLDIGCGWGGALERAITKFDVNVIGITLSKEQSDWARKRLAKLDTKRNVEVRLQGWEEFDEPVDRIVSIGAFEAFKVERYPLFFERAYSILPEGGTMLLHTILAHTQEFFRENNIKLTISDLKFMKFIGDEIFPGGRLPAVEDIEKLAADSGFDLQRTHLLQPHYARTLDMWAANLEASQGRGDRPAESGSLRPVYEVPDRLCRLLPPRYHQHRAVHARQVSRLPRPSPSVCPSSCSGSSIFFRSPSEPARCGTPAYEEASRFFSASTSKSAGGQDKSSALSASMSSSMTASRLYHFRSHGTTCHGA